jgi:GNAT superfamily N-acetyltransferase
VGWCQYGPREELPRIDGGRKYRKLPLADPRGKLWRITCFFVDNDFRRKGVARVALRAALASIRREGGGTVEAYPATHGRAVGIWFGTVAMFRAEGFMKVADYCRSNVLVRRTLRGGGRSSAA